MTPNKLLAALSSEEDNFVERKPQNVNEREIRKTIVAFANSVPEGRTAVLFIGVEDDGSISGCDNTDALQKKIRKQCYNVCYPPIKNFECEVITVDSKDIVAVQVNHSIERPHFAGQAYVRCGSESVAASPDMFNEIVDSRHSKTGQILQFKDMVVSVETIQHKLGDTKRVSDAKYRTFHECNVIECNAHFVRLYDISTQITHSEPLDCVTIKRDEEKRRLLLLISGL